MYYANKVALLKDIFGVEAIELTPEALIIADKRLPIIDDVIVCLDPAQWPARVRRKLAVAVNGAAQGQGAFAEDIQFTFGAEWVKYPKILPEHRHEFEQYFDMIDLAGLQGKRVCDLGCGIGRWSFFLKDKCRELVLVDFSEAVFVARENLRGADNAVFIMADLTALPLRERFADLVFCLGVLHHLPVNALDVARQLKKYAPELLIYLYYSLDNRPVYFRILLGMATWVRLGVTRIRSDMFRSVFTGVVAAGVYWPLVQLGRLFSLFGLARMVPLYEGYRGKSLGRIKQDVYDRFFTRIEQRFSRQEILGLKDAFDSVIVSEGLPYWHFLCRDKKGS